MGVPVFFHNVNAADADRRAAVIEHIRARFDARRGDGADPFLAVFLHSLAFGATLSYVTTDREKKELTQKQLEMTVDVMAHSLVYWVHDLFHAGLFANGSRAPFAMTSEGAEHVVPTYGAVSPPRRRPVPLPAAGHGAHPPGHHRQLHPRRGDRHAWRSGASPVTRSCARPLSIATPGGRLTGPEDVAEALVALASPRLHWMTGNVIGVDGGEMIGARQHGVEKP
jgi:NAD(P)-dependent dehydrogenase (short-subunit alcohol dehydrogenase family)